MRNAATGRQDNSLRMGAGINRIFMHAGVMECLDMLLDNSGNVARSGGSGCEGT